MNEYKTQYFWSVDIKMLTPSAEELTISIKEANFILSDEGATEARLSVKVDKKTYEKIDRLEAFNLQQDKRKESALEDFADNKPVELELILSKLQIKKLDSKINNAEKLIDVLHKLTYSNTNSPLLQTENWFALNVKQEIDVPQEMGGSLKMGYATVWADGFENEIIIPPYIQQIFNYFNRNATNCLIINTAFHISFEYYYENRKWDCLLVPKEEFNQIILYTYSPYKVKEEEKMQVCKKLTEINFDLPIGNFEFNFEKGEVRFKTYTESASSEISEEQLKLLLDANIYTINKFIK